MITGWLMLATAWLARARAAASGSGPVTRDGARGAAQNELSKPIYHRDDPPWPVRLFRWIWHELNTLLDKAGSHAPGGTAGAVALLAAVIVLVVIAWLRLGPMQRNRQRPGSVLGDGSVSAADHLAAAVAAAATGDWVTAVLERMRALAQSLEDDGTIDPRPGRTAHELAAEVTVARPNSGNAIQAAARVFDDVIYGGRVATQESYATVVRADE